MRLLSYDSSQYLISALDLPGTGQILDEDDGRPYIAVSLVLDPALLADVASTLPPTRDPEPQGVGVAINPMTTTLCDALLRLLSLLDSPADIPALAPMAERGLLYRLLRGPQGRLCARSPVRKGPWPRSARPWRGSGTAATSACALRRCATPAA
ncbi:AraC family transcriptional regulator [Caulobacter segnis]